MLGSSWEEGKVEQLFYIERATSPFKDGQIHMVVSFVKCICINSMLFVNIEQLLSQSKAVNGCA